MRCDEQRSDVLKALVIGPEDTPYQNGCFVFDILLPTEYPQTCPLVQLVTTHGGQCRFNPNLYADGKVCLSLLGTWEGPGLDPKTSTLHQVLVSIHSLIMVPDPYYNEPGNEGGLSKKYSEQYNKCIRLFTARAAILGQLEEPNPVFADVINMHFALKRDSVQQQVNGWLAGAPPTGSDQLGPGPYGVESGYGGRGGGGKKKADEVRTDFDPKRVKAAVAAALKKLSVPPAEGAA